MDNIIKVFDINRIVDWYKTYTNNSSAWGITKLVLDIILSIGLIVLLFYVFQLKFRNRLIYLIMSGVIVVYALLFLMNFSIIIGLVRKIAFLLVGVIFLVYSQNIKTLFDRNFRSLKHANAFDSEEEKQKVIDILVSTAKLLGEKKVGALIVLEREDSLNSIIDKSIILKAQITKELLSTIFYVGTDTHDGAVIIRKNLVMCAGAYLPTTDKYDVPKTLGTRHRAAIGLSERYDSFTIVVSEETGKISTTLDGIINIDITPEELKNKLETVLKANSK